MLTKDSNKAKIPIDVYQLRMIDPYKMNIDRNL